MNVPRQRAARRATARRGMTVIELLVVIMVIVMLVAATIPIMASALEGRKTREGARLLNQALADARNRAQEIGRPAGIMIERHANESRVSTTVYPVEVPPPYSGDLYNSTVQVRVAGGQVTATVTNAGSFTPQLVHPGDRMQINYQGPIYRIVSVSAGSIVLDGDVDDDGTSDVDDLPWKDNPSGGLPYVIWRQPERVGGTPVQLPDGIVIDLSLSSHEADHDLGDGLEPIVLTFGPSGRPDRIDDGHHEPEPLVDNLYLLIGKREKRGAENVNDLANLWVTVGHRTGLITTAHVTSGDPKQLARQQHTAGGQ